MARVRSVVVNPQVDWVVLTRGDRNAELATSVNSLKTACTGEIVVVVNTELSVDPPSEDVRMIRPGYNLGVPGGRNLGMLETQADFVGFLDDDGWLDSGVTEKVIEVFSMSDDIAVVALRVVDEFGETARRHVPWSGTSGVEKSRLAATFLGGACVIRRKAFDQVGGYFAELIYGHEEIEFAWRLNDAGWKISFQADLLVNHPRSEISRHVDGWRLTGRNRVLIARRTLPHPLSFVHVMVWLLLGLRRAPSGCKMSYLRGWCAGWSFSVDRNPISWRTTAQLGRYGRFPAF